MHVCGRVEKHDPFATSEGFRFSGKRMNLPIPEFFRGGTFELNRELMRIKEMTRDNKMHVIAKHGTGMDREFCSLRIGSETCGDGFDLSNLNCTGGRLSAVLAARRSLAL
jgi:hypothetical protein